MRQITILKQATQTHPLVEDFYADQIANEEQLSKLTQKPLSGEQQDQHRQALIQEITTQLQTEQELGMTWWHDAYESDDMEAFVNKQRAAQGW